MVLRLSFCLSVLRVARGRRLLSADLRTLSDRYLADMGIERGEIDAYVRSSVPWPIVDPAPAPAFTACLQGCG